MAELDGQTPAGRPTRPLGLLAVAAYVATVALANKLTAHYGFVTVWPKPHLTATAGTYIIGCAFVCRIFVQDAWGNGKTGRLVMFGAILAGAALSWEVATASLALASGVTFLISETADWAIYTPIRRRGWARAAIAGNTAGAVVDTFLFLWLAGFPIIAAVPGQLVGKAYATLIYLVLGLGVRRALSRVPVHADAA